jgi:hypothetical protein
MRDFFPQHRIFLTEKTHYRVAPEAPVGSAESADVLAKEVMDETQIQESLLREKVMSTNYFTRHQELVGKSQNETLSELEFTERERVRMNMFMSLTEAASLTLPKGFDQNALERKIFGTDGLLKEWQMEDARADLMPLMNDVRKLSEGFKALGKDWEKLPEAERIERLAKSFNAELNSEQRNVLAQIDRESKDLAMLHGVSQGATIDYTEAKVEEFNKWATGNLRKPGSVLLKGAAVLGSAMTVMGVAANFVMPAISGGFAMLTHLNRPQDIPKAIKEATAGMSQTALDNMKKVGGMAAIGGASYLMLSGKPYETAKSWLQSAQNTTGSAATAVGETAKSGFQWAKNTAASAVGATVETGGEGRNLSDPAERGIVETIEGYKYGEAFNKNKNMIYELIKPVNKPLEANFGYLNNLGDQTSLQVIQGMLRQVLQNKLDPRVSERCGIALRRAELLTQIQNESEEIRFTLGIPRNKFKLGDFANFLMKAEREGRDLSNDNLVQEIGNWIFGSVLSPIGRAFVDIGETAQSIWLDLALNKAPAYNRIHTATPKAPAEELSIENQLEKAGVEYNPELKNRDTWVGKIRTMTRHLKLLNNPSARTES